MSKIEGDKKSNQLSVVRLSVQEILVGSALLNPNLDPAVDSNSLIYKKALFKAMLLTMTFIIAICLNENTDTLGN